MTRNYPLSIYLSENPQTTVEITVEWLLLNIRTLVFEIAFTLLRFLRPIPLALAIENSDLKDYNDRSKKKISAFEYNKEENKRMCCAWDLRTGVPSRLDFPSFLFPSPNGSNGSCLVDANGSLVKPPPMTPDCCLWPFTNGNDQWTTTHYQLRQTIILDLLIQFL